MEIARYLRASDACVYIGVSRASLYRLVKRGVAPKPIKLSPGLVVWDREDLDRAILQRKEIGLQPE